jgi:mRNA-degrading endonuclease toxin of MazEF toxin-antitoxin module
VVITQGEVWWADLAEPVGSAPGYRRPVVVLQADPINRSQIATVVCVVLSSNLDKRQFIERAGKVPKKQLEGIFSGIDLLMGR